MHQTFYIDIDEEITSIVERLRNSKSEEVVIVVPKRALLIQSIVNLRLLKKESDGLGISLSIVTQDPLGKVLIEKAGISYQAKLDELRDEGNVEISSRIGGENAFDANQFLPAASYSAGGGSSLDKIGSDSYFSENSSSVPKDGKKDIPPSVGDIKKQKEISQGNSEKIINKELVTGIGDDIRRKKNYASMDVALPAADNSSFAKDTAMPKDINVSGFSRNDSLSKISAEPNIVGNPYQIPYKESSGDRKIDSFFQHDNQRPEEKKSDFKNSNLSKHIKKAFLIFGIILVVFVALAGVYLFLPKATVLIATKASQKSQDVEVKGDVNVQAVDFDNEIVPAKLISETAEVTKEINSSGSKSVSNKKAKGTLTIYNEFSSSPQPLVATTRFESESGKIFRITKGITVPGTSTVGGETKPGAIEAEVEADEAGDSYNIDPGKFTIPGFKDSGNDKYSKIYAKSTSKMAGGGSGDAGNDSKSISESDINNAKAQLQTELKSAIKEKIKSSAGSGMIVLDDAISTEEATYSLSNSAGEVVDKFQAKGQIKGTALVFNESDLKSVVARMIAKSENSKASMDGGTITLNYGKADVDSKAGTILIKVNGTSSVSTDIDLDNLKKGILGKTNEELETYLGTYSSIEKADVTYWPPFMNSKIPIYEKRVEIIVNSDSVNK
jgi:hypothetical protein